MRLAAQGRAPKESRDYINRVLADAPEEMRVRACQVVSELVTNSVRFAGGESVTVAVHVNDGGNSVDLEVRDDGNGFDQLSKAPGHADTEGWGLVLVDMLTESWAAGGIGCPVVRAHFEPRSLDDPAAPSDPMLEERLRSLLDVRLLLDSIKDYAIFAVTREGEITLWNAGGERLTGYSPDEILGSRLDALHDESDVAGALSAARAHGRHEIEGWIRRKDGSRFWADSIVTPVFDRAAHPRGFSVISRDVTWRKHLNDGREDLLARVRRLARTDDLTGLANRRRWHEELDRELARSRRAGAHVCVAMLDLDGFKAYNDTHGHVAGDELLTSTARAWSAAIRTTDMLARYGGDEFSLLLPDCGLDEAMTVVERMRTTTPRPVTCSAGLAESSGSESTESVIRRADTALYQAKRSGRDVTSVAP